MPGQARHGDGYSAVSQPPFLRKQETGNTQYHACKSRNPSIPFLRKQESNGCRVKPGMVTGTATYHNHHSCENRKPVILNTMHAKAGILPYHSCESRNPPIPFLRKQESNGCRVKPGMVTGTAPYHNHHSCESRKPVILNTMHAKAGILPYHSCESRNGTSNFRAGSQFYRVESESMILPWGHPLIREVNLGLQGVLELVGLMGVPELVSVLELRNLWVSQILIIRLNQGVPNRLSRLAA